MPGLDFNRIKRSSTADSASEPRQIFTTLPSKEKRYGYARDVQSEVWAKWHDRRSERDLVIKMNTGGGKTVVGLVLLKSCLNEGAGPVAYITPDVYLAQQVCAEAQALGIETVDSPDSPRFLASQAVFVGNIYKLFNGRSVFGVKGASRPVVEIGTILVDDAHACLATVEEQFTLRIPAEHSAYEPLLKVFAPDLKRQSRPTFADLEANDPSALMAIPSWAWADRQQEVIDILHPCRNEDEIGFHWPLIADSLAFCQVAISSHGIEIAPPCLPVDEIPSFANAKRRVYLTATLADDSILVTHFEAEAGSISKPITPKTADDLGDRMILTPQQTFPGISDEEIRDFLVERAQRENVVVIVPSYRRAEEFWKGVANAIHGADTLQLGIAALREKHVGLVVLINKYDGIDLPETACEILVLDGLPEARGELARMESTWLDQSDALLTRQVQRIEQGMGRGIRSNDDYCVVLLLGKRLTGRLHPPTARAMFSPGTRAQLELSDEIAAQLQGSSLSDLDAVVDQCLERDPGWVAASRDCVVGLSYPEEISISGVARAQREAFEFAQRGRFSDAAESLRSVVNGIDDEALRGLIKQEAATYMHQADPVAAQKLQASAVGDNRSLMRPRDGIAYVPLRRASDQAVAAGDFLAGKYATPPDLVIGFAAITDVLVPNPDPASVNPFEQALRDLGEHLGFGAERPERDTGNGPDVLWLLQDMEFLVIECKSAATVDAISRSDISQLSHSMNWFAREYPTANATPVLIHPTVQLDEAAVASDDTQIIPFEQLASLRDAVTRFATAVGPHATRRDHSAVAERLASEHLNGAALMNHWGKRPKRHRRVKKSR